MEISSIALNIDESWTKKEVREAAAERAGKFIESADEKIVEDYVQLRKIQEYLSVVTEAVLNEVIDRVEEKGGEVQLAEHKAKLKLSNTPTYYDYAKNPFYVATEKKLKELKESIKFASTKNKAVLDESTGEMIEPVPVKKQGGVTVRLTY